MEQGRRDSNPQPLVLETSALPIELRPFAFPNLPHPGECTECSRSGAIGGGQRQVSVRGPGPEVEQKPPEDRRRLPERA
ncbi:hypothetical protein SSAG_02846 [Streptomyces sp. Mg1]|nr:hypothetical protein SSAG_02846 [Streptomyces sp. Mg1]